MVERLNISEKIPSFLTFSTKIFLSTLRRQVPDMVTVVMVVMGNKPGMLGERQPKR
jgi:hypothetical protein